MHTIASLSRTRLATPRRLGGLAVALVCLSAPVHAQITLGSAGAFSVLGGVSVSNTGLTTISGDLGVAPGAIATGFGPGVVLGSIHLNDADAIAAQSDAATAYGALAALSFDQNLTGQNLGGLTLSAGVYRYSSSALLNGVLTLDGQGQAASIFVFQIASTLTTGSASFNLINGARAANVYFQVGSSATLGAGTSFAGTIIAHTSETLVTGVSVDGRVFALNGTVTLDTNEINTPAVVPEPAATAFVASVVVAVAAIGRRRRSGRVAAV